MPSDIETTSVPETKPLLHGRNLFLLFRHFFLRALGIFSTIYLGVFITVIIMNQNKFIDDAVRREASVSAMHYLQAHPELDHFTSEKARDQFRTDLAEQMADKAGINLPYWPRHLVWTWNMLTFNWPDVRGFLATDSGTWITFRAQDAPLSLRYSALAIVGQYFPNTLLIIGVAYALVFSFGVPLALTLSRRYNHLLDRLVTSLAPLSSIPSWAYGILLVSIFAFQLRWLPYGGKYDLIPPENDWEYIPIVARHMVLPVLAVIMSMFFQIVYTWRTYFMLYTQEDYVELAIAKGIPARTLDLRYILRPSLPYILTSFALTLTSFWQMTTALEYYFNWPGIGWMYIRSLLMDDLVVSLGVVVIFAYVLGGVVLFLDLAYMVVDPRIRFDITTSSHLQSRLARTKIKTPRRRKQLRLTLPRIVPSEWWHAFTEWYIWSARPFLNELRRYPAALASLTLIGILVAASVYAMFTYPYTELDQLWSPSLSSYRTRPDLARPTWYNWFLPRDLPENITLDTRANPKLKKSTPITSGQTITITYTFTVPDGDFPQAILLYFHTKYDSKAPFASITWITPDRREFKLRNRAMIMGNYYDLAENVPTRYLDSRYRRENLTVNKGGESPLKALFANPTSAELTPLAGTYQLRIDAITFETESNVDVEFVLFGQVYGWAGTDNLRRDLGIGLLWGLPVALGIGMLGALTTSLLAMSIAAGGAWVGGWLDGLIQRITETNMILPVLAVGVLLSINYDVSIWTVLLIAILLNAFGSTTRGYRAAFLQAKEAPYVEAARAYGAGDTRIITRYLIPRIFPMMIPQVVMLIPGYVFLEATLAIFGVSTPYVPTWGRIIFDALRRGALHGYYYWVLEPVSLLLITSLAFAVLGFTLDRVLNPRLLSDVPMVPRKPTAQPRFQLSRGVVASLAAALILMALLALSTRGERFPNVFMNSVNEIPKPDSGTIGPPAPVEDMAAAASLPTVVSASRTEPLPTLAETPTLFPTVASTPTPPLIESAPTARSADSRPATYAVHKGEYPYCIARRFNVDPNELLALNGLLRSQTVYVGTVLHLPQTGNPFPGERIIQAHPATYVVSAPSETMYTIACAFGDLDPTAIAQANNLAVDSRLSIGQQLNIP